MRITLMAIIGLTSLSVLAEESNMEHVLVSVPMHKKMAETTLPITVLNGATLQRQAATTIGETLGNTPGLANASFGPAVGQPVIRGQQGARVTVLQNGTSSADVSNISPDHAISVEPLLADSVEVLRGPATLLYGGGAIGGVVNIIDNRIPTSPIEDVSGGIEIRHDTASELNSVAARLEAGNGAWAVHADGLYRDWSNVEIPGYAINDPEAEGNSHGFIGNSDGDTNSYNLGAAYHFDKGFFGLAISGLESNYGIPPLSLGHDPDEEEVTSEKETIRLDVEQTRYDASLHLHDTIPAFDVLRGFLTYTDYQHAEIEGAGEIGTRFKNNTWETRLEMVHKPVNGFHGVLGGQWQQGRFSAIGEEAFVPRTDSIERGLFVVEDFHQGDWTFEGGLRYDRAERDPDTTFSGKAEFDSLSVSMSALWELNQDWSLGAGISSSERAPVTEELYSNIEATSDDELVVHAATGNIELGDSDLQQETSRNLDLTINWRPGTSRLTVNLFYNDFKDYITLANAGRTVDDIPVLAYVQADAIFHGAELEMQIKLGDMGGGQLGLNLGGDVVRGKLDNLGDAPRLPPYRLRAEVNWDQGTTFLFMRVLKAADQDRPGEGEAKTDGYTRWDAGMDYRLPVAKQAELLLFLKLKNFTDEEIRLSTSFLRDAAPEAGRSLEAGLRFTF